MRVAIVWICAVASLCGSIDGSVLRPDGNRNSQIVESVLGSNDDYLDNKIEENFEEDSVETTTKYKCKQRFEPHVNHHRSTTRRTVDPDQVWVEIQKKATITRPQTGLSTNDEQIDPKPETTTEYKYKDLVEPYIIPQPKYIPMKHAVGTHYVKVERGQNEYDRVMEDYKRLFDRDSRPVLPDYAPPPKF